jgi:phosphoribosylaminoimidazole-succinocarboxamide synthase
VLNLILDSSRFWSVHDYSPGSPQKSYDKQYLRDYLTSISFDKKEGIKLPQEIISATLEKYIEAFKILTGKMPVL